MTYSFSINMYDKDGDEFDNCVIAHCGPNTMLRFENTSEMEKFAQKMLDSVKEIRENYPDI